MKFAFFSQIFEKIQILDLIKIPSVPAKLFYADGPTYMTKIIVAFRNLSTCLKMEI
jgi:hypothetical protein